MIVTVRRNKYDLSQLPWLGGGGEGEVYKTPDGFALKVYNDYSVEVERKLKDCVTNDVYSDIAILAVPPIHLAYDDNNRVLGYTMRLLGDFLDVSDMTDLSYCLPKRVTLRMIGSLFVYLHEALERVHADGFVVGDYRGANIKFKPLQKNEQGEWQIAMMDVDGWAVTRGRIVYPCSAIQPDIIHPELSAKRSLSGLTSRHDWYAFAHLLASSLLKCNPFTLGTHALSSDQRRLSGITAWDASVSKTVIEQSQCNRIGQLMTQTLEGWLSGQEYGIFPKHVIVDFVRSLVYCKSCGYAINRTLSKCPRCGNAV